MLKDEKGVTFMESIFSLGLILLVATSFFPMMLDMREQAEMNRKQTAAYRLLYEHVKQVQHIEGTPETRTVLWNHTEYRLQMTGGAACASFDHKQICIP